MNIFQEEYEVKRMRNVSYLQTKIKDYHSYDYRKNGELKKGRKKKHYILLCCYSNLDEKVLRMLADHHNLWINRKNPERQKEILEEILSEIEAKVR
jgi:hypothetical protein